MFFLDKATARLNWNVNPLRTNLTIATNSNDNINNSVSIGDMYLNDSVTYLHANLGTWTISGDIKQQGELIMVMWGLANPGGTPIGAVNGNTVATLNIKYSTLLEMIENNHFFLNPANGAWARLRIGAEFDYDTVTGTSAWDAYRVTLANMYDKLDIVSLGGGMVQVHAIPEPATMILLGLGALVLRRKR